MLRNGNSKKKIIRLATMFAVILVVVSVMLSLMQPGIALTGGDLTGSDTTADVETEETWKQSFAGAELTENYNSNLVSIANTQIGYKESELNYYTVTETNEHKGYTRYGAFDNDNYMNWDTSFVDFCMNYAGYPEDVLGYFSNNVDTWIQSLQFNDLYADSTTEYQLGDLVFFQKANQETSKQVGIITEVNVREDGTYISVVEGNCDNEVKKNEYSINDTNIIGYALLHRVQEESQEDDINAVSNEILDTDANQQYIQDDAEDEMEITNEYSDEEIEQYNADESIAVVDAQNEVNTYNLTDVATVKVNISSDSPSIGDVITGSLQFDLDLTKISTDKDVVLEYQLPNGLTVEKEMSGELQGNVKGTYKITTDGKIIVQYSKESIIEYQDFGKINGGVSFEAKVSQYTDGGSINFPGTDTTIHVKRDMNVEKTQGKKNEDGSYHYSINVSTKSGTPGDVIINDTASIINSSGTEDTTGKLSYKNLVIKDENGNVITVDNPSFPLTLPQLDANKKYTVEYDVVIDEFGDNYNKNNTDIKLKNIAKATSGEISKESEKITWVANQKLSKTFGWYDSKNREVHWSISITNADKKDLSELGELKDIFGDKIDGLVDGSFVVTDTSSWKKVENGTFTNTDKGFTYTFPQGSTSESYTIEYVTKVEESEQDYVATNTVDYRGNSLSAKGDIKVKNWSVEKSNSSKLEDVDETTKKLNWNVAIGSSEKETTNKIEYSDIISDAVDEESGESLTDIHYTTVSELKNSLQNTLLLKFQDKDLNIYTSNDYTVNLQCYSDKEMTTLVTDDNSKVQSFKLTIERKDKKIIEFDTINFNYYTFIDNEKIKYLNDWNVKNKGIFLDKESTSKFKYTKTENRFVKERIAEWKVDSGVAKKDDVELSSVNGELYYRILVSGSTSFPCEITDTLGKGMKLKTDENGNPELLIAYRNATDWTTTEGNPENYVKYEKLSSDDADNEVWKFTINDYHRDGFNGPDGIEILYKVDITSEKAWEDSTTEELDDGKKFIEVFTNSASWNDQVKNTDTTVYHIIKDFDKSVECDTTGENAYKPRYRVVINANGKDLNANGDTLELEDTLSFGSNNSVVYAYLNLSDVKLYYYDSTKPGNKGDEIDPTRYNVKYIQNIEYQSNVRKIIITVPDELPCVLEYQYSLDSDFKNNIWLSNSVNLNGKEVTKSSLTVQKSSGYSHGYKFVVQKIDADKNSKMLPGAKFKLYSYDESSKQFVQITTDSTDGLYITDENGKLNLTRALFTGDSEKTDCLLMMIETEAPEGYKLNSEPTYFVLEKDKKVQDIYYSLDNTYKNDNWSFEENVYSKIEQSNINNYSQYGGEMYIQNTSNQIIVKKVWLDSDGKELSNPPDNITFNLNKTSHNITDGTELNLYVNRYGGIQKIGTYYVKKFTNITLSFDTNKDASTSDITAKLDNINLTSIEKESDKYGKAYSYTVSFEIKGDKTQYDLVLDPNGKDEWGIQTNVSDYSFSFYGDTVSTPITLDSSTNWTYTTEAETDAVYTVSEVKVNGKPIDESNYTVSYYNNDGIDHGEIVITNKQKDKVYELPSTGGTGTIQYYIGGAILMLLATSLYFYRKRQKPERRISS